MFKKIIITALFAGFIVGVVSALLQLIYVQPILLHAELYETGSLTHFGENNSKVPITIVHLTFNVMV